MVGLVNLAALRITLFIVLSYIFAFTIDLIATISPLGSFIWGFVRMWSVTLSVALCMLIFREKLSIHFKRYLKISKKALVYYLVAPLIVYGALAIYIAIALPLNLFNFSVYIDIISTSLRSTLPSLSEEQIMNLATIAAYTQIISGYIAAISINAFFALGEEIGWRGYLYSVLGVKPTLLNTVAIGVLWGLWHSSAILLLGYNYSVNRVLGVLLFTLYAIVVSYPHLLITSAADSVIPASSLHGAVNALWGLTIVASNLSIELREVLLGLGVLGIATWIIVSIALYILLHRRRV